MSSRLRLTLMALATAVIVAAAVVVLTTSTSSSGRGTVGFAGGIRPPGAPVDFTLRDEAGHAVSTRDLRGRPAIVTFLYTACKDDCPTIAAQIRLALDRLQTAVPVLAVTVDPANDTQAARRRFLRRQHLKGDMRFLSGSPAELERVWSTFGIRPQERGLEHTAYVVLLGRDGRQRVGFPVDKVTPEGIVHDVRILAG